MTEAEINTECQRLAAIDMKDQRLKPSRHYGPLQLSGRIWALAEIYALTLRCTPEQAIIHVLDQKLHARVHKSFVAAYRNVLTSSPSARLAVAYGHSPCNELASSQGECP